MYITREYLKMRVSSSIMLALNVHAASMYACLD